MCRSVELPTFISNFSESHSALEAEHDYDQFGEKGDHDHEHHEDEEDEHHHHDEVHQYIGLSLLIGFLVMLLIDNLGGSHGHSHGGETPKAEAAKLLERHTGFAN